MKYLILAVTVLASACAVDDYGRETRSVEGAIASCPIPTTDAIAGYENDFYLCAEQYADHGAGCGEDGYLVGYGAKYAERFYTETRPWMSTRGQEWIDQVLVCLQHELRSSIDETTSCEDIRTIAFDSHPVCYLEHGLCQLPPWDIAKVLWTVDLSDWFSADAARQIAAVAAGCGESYARMIAWWFWYL
jgi:hypothetical protein